MTENKRFEFREVNNCGITSKVWDNEKQEYANLLECVDWLNDLLYNENQEVFDSIDNRLRYYQEFLENEKRNGREIMLLQRIVDDLKDLKRIKKGDDLNDKILGFDITNYYTKSEMAHHRVEENALQDKINSLREERRQLKIIAELLMEYIKVNCTDDIVMHARNLMDGYKLSDWSEDYQEWRDNL